MVVSGVGERISLFVDVDSVEVESYGLLLQDFLATDPYVPCEEGGGLARN
jgi:hypothetical protein